MKKVLIWITAAACAAVMCDGLVACGSGVNAKDVKSIQVNEDEWNSAFAYFDSETPEFSVEMSTEQTTKASGQNATMTGTLSFRIKDGKTYGKMESKVSGNAAGGSANANGSEEEYTATENDVFCVYSKGDDGKWTRTEHGTSTFISMLSGLVYGPDFSDFEYSEENKGYVAKNTEAGLPVTVYKFGKVGNDVRLVAIYSHSETKVETVETSFTANYVVNYNNVADITLPTVG